MNELCAFVTCVRFVSRDFFPFYCSISLKHYNRVIKTSNSHLILLEYGQVNNTTHLDSVETLINSFLLLFCFLNDG